MNTPPIEHWHLNYPDIMHANCMEELITARNFYLTLAARSDSDAELARKNREIQVAFSHRRNLLAPDKSHLHPVI